MRKQVMCCCALLALLMPPGYEQSAQKARATALFRASTSDTVIAEVNRYRRRAGLIPMRLEPRLSQAAQRHADFMAACRCLDHAGPRGQSPWHRLQDSGVRFSRMAENLAQGQDSPRAVVRAWMQSPEHRRNLLNPALQRLGLGRQGDYWVLSLTD